MRSPEVYGEGEVRLNGCNIPAEPTCAAVQVLRTSTRLGARSATIHFETSSFSGGQSRGLEVATVLRSSHLESLELHRRSGRRQTRYRQICVKVGDLNWRTRLANGYNYSACANSNSKACQNARAAYAEHHNGKLLGYTTITGIRGDRDAGASRVRTGDGSSRQRRPSPAPLATQWC
jgi:hypothetical protein